MKTWAFASLQRAVRPRWARRAVAVLGVAVSAVLLLVLLGARRGLTEGIRAYAGQDGIDLWVAPRGTDNLVRSSGLLPLPLLGAIEQDPDVQVAQPVLRAFVSVRTAPGDLDLPSAATTLLAMGYRGPDGLGGPPALVTGRGPASPDEVVLDRAAAVRLGVEVGDRVLANDRELEVVGVSRGTNLFATQFAFLDGTAAERAAGLTGRVSFFVVQLRPGADATATAARIEDRISTVRAWPTDHFVARNQREILAGFRPFLVLVTLLSAASATLLVALLVQGAVDDRRRDLAVLFALGVPLRNVAGAVLAESAAIVALGVAGGGLGGVVLQNLLHTTVPALELLPRAQDVLIVGLLFGIGAVVASPLPVLRLRRIDPVEAFRP